jgi:hypothetical protein
MAAWCRPASCTRSEPRSDTGALACRAKGHSAASAAATHARRRVSYGIGRAGATAARRTEAKPRERRSRGSCPARQRQRRTPRAVAVVASEVRIGALDVDPTRRLQQVDRAVDRLCQRGTTRKTLPVRTAGPPVATTRAMPATQSSSHGSRPFLLNGAHGSSGRGAAAEARLSSVDSSIGRPQRRPRSLPASDESRRRLLESGRSAAPRAKR